MKTYKVGYLIGSLAKASINRKLAKALVKLAPPELVLQEIAIGELPLYSYDYDADYPEVARRFKRALAEVDAVLFVTPEYNRSIPGALKNAIDWASRPWGELVQAQAFRRSGHLARLHRHRGGAAAVARGAVLLQFAADEHHGSLYPVHPRPDR